MPAPASSPAVLQFGVFELDLRRAELRKQGVRVKLQEQPLKVLQLLLENRGQIVTREQLRAHIWPDNTFVEFDHGLYSAMARLRDALGDSSESPRYIETVARRGYRFIASLSSSTDPSEIAQQESLPHRSGGLRKVATSFVIGLAAGALLLAFISYRWPGRNTSPPNLQNMRISKLTENGEAPRDLLDIHDFIRFGLN